MVNNSRVTTGPRARYQPKWATGEKSQENAASGVMRTTPGPAFFNRGIVISSLAPGPSRRLVAGFASPTLVGIWSVSRMRWSEGSPALNNPPVPRPRSATESRGESGSLLAIWTVAPRTAAAVGLKLILRLVEVPAARLAGRPLRRSRDSPASAPVTGIDLQASAPEPGFLKLNDCGPLAR